MDSSLFALTAGSLRLESLARGAAPMAHRLPVLTDSGPHADAGREVHAAPYAERPPRPPR